MYNPYQLTGKTILVTGASSGIGRATAVECSRLGAKVVMTARNRERLEQTLNVLEGNGHQIITCDISDNAERESLVEQCPSIDGLVNNAGIGDGYKTLKFIKHEMLEDVLQTNTNGPILLLSSLVKHKKLKKFSSVVFTSSVSGLGGGSVGNGMYAASKGALCAFVPVAAKELAHLKIRVNAVCPDMIKTSMNAADTITEEQNNENMKQYPLGRWGSPEEVAWAIIYLLSDASAFTSGINLRINGGRN